MFWNIQGTSSVQYNYSETKRQCVQHYVNKHVPDLIFFSEVSHLLDHAFLEGYNMIAYSKELTKHGDEGTKDLRMYAKRDSPFKWAREGSSGDVRSFLITKLSYGGKELVITGLHARASIGGGMTNIHYISTNPNYSIRNTSYIFGGDFNLDLNTTYSWGDYGSGNPEQFVNTYYNGEIIRPVTKSSPFGVGTQKSGGLLDYIITKSFGTDLSYIEPIDPFN